jgi:hypothetical protein
MTTPHRFMLIAMVLSVLVPFLIIVLPKGEALLWFSIASICIWARWAATAD